MAGAMVVVVPLRASDAPHGHTTVAQALRLGKAVVTTRGASVEDYVRDGVEGLLVEPGDARDTGHAVAGSPGTTPCEPRARRPRAGRRSSTYESFARSLEAICLEVLEETAEEAGSVRPTERLGSLGRAPGEDGVEHLDVTIGDEADRYGRCGSRATIPS